MEDRQDAIEASGPASERPSAQTQPAQLGRYLDRLAVPLAVGVVAALAIPRLPPGICLDDSGDLQLASATLGIAHPPGYAGYVSLGYLLTRLPGLTPAHAVTLACLAAGLIALGLCGRMQIRLGASPWVAGAMMLLLAGRPQFWENLLVPEVYGPTLLLEAAAAYWLARYVAQQRWRDLLAAALSLGLALANRPPVLLALPMFALACAIGLRARRPDRRRRRREAVLIAAGLIVPCIYSVAYVYVRDTPATPCNYIEQHRAVTGALPPADAGTAAKLERLTWLLTAQKFRYLLADSPRGLPARLTWLIDELGLRTNAVFVAVVALVAAGAVTAYRRCPSTTLALGGMALAAVVFSCVYRVWDSAADVLPILFATAVFAGVCASRLLPAVGGWFRRIAAMTLFVGVCVYTVYALAGPAEAAQQIDATTFVSEARLADLPTGAVVISSWRRSVALQYHQHVELRRADLRILGAHRAHWERLIRQYGRGPAGEVVPLYLADPTPPASEYRPTPHGNLWRLNAFPWETGQGPP